MLKERAQRGVLDVFVRWLSMSRLASERIRESENVCGFFGKKLRQGARKREACAFLFVFVKMRMKMVGF